MTGGEMDGAAGGIQVNGVEGITDIGDSTVGGGPCTVGAACMIGGGCPGIKGGVPCTVEYIETNSGALGRNAAWSNGLVSSSTLDSISRARASHQLHST